MKLGVYALSMRIVQTSQSPDPAIRTVLLPLAGDGLGVSC
jgi:hypothetical protein